MADYLFRWLKVFMTMGKDQLQSALSQAGAHGRSLEQILAEDGRFTEEEVLKHLAEVLGLEYRDSLHAKDVPAEFKAAVRANFARRHGIVAAGRDNGTMILATCNPLSTYPLEDIEKKLHLPTRLVVSPRSEVAGAIDAAYEDRMDVVEEIVEELDDATMESLAHQAGSSDDLLDVVNKPPVIRLVNSMLFRALKMRASDIHVHPYENKLQIRYRIDGVLYDVFSPARSVQPLITSRIKVMAGMDIAERRMPQDGRCSVRIGDREIDLRVSIVPTSYGERVVLRILDKTSGVYDLMQLGLDEELRAKVLNLITMSHGIIFVTGPTGSGKTTTLYAALNRINSAEKNVLTVEDPIEYQLNGISQIQVAHKKGLTFATTLRHVVRQDPDVIMVGEVRDLETARLAIQASLTGHLVFSTLHTNDAPGAVARILDLGIEPYLVSSSLLAVLAQRLVRRTCQACKEPYEPDPRIVQQLDVGDVIRPGTPLWQGRGCDECLHTGYHGRVGIYELLMVDDEVRTQIQRRDSAAVMKASAVARGMRTLRMDGALKALSGETTLDEIMRVTQRDIF
jgi:general secretion pathway protein E